MRHTDECRVGQRRREARCYAHSGMWQSVAAGAVAAVVAVTTRKLRDPRLLVFVAGCGVVITFALRRRLPIPSADPHTRFDLARRQHNSYEAFYQARRWGRAEPAGALEAARLARDFELFSACGREAHHAALDPRLAEESRGIEADCLALAGKRTR